MGRIVDIKVINQDTTSNFETALQEAVNELQKKTVQGSALKITINNPHLVVADGTYYYIAVVEGYKEE